PIFGAEKLPRRAPYILTLDQIRPLIEAASRLGYRTLRRAAHSTPFALLGWTGLRGAEGLRLCFGDITPDGFVVCRMTILKSRLVPLHDTARTGLERYLQQRGPYAPFDDHIFVSIRRKPLLPADVDMAFRTAAKQIGLPHGRGRPRPTPHSLRHAFAVRALQTCPAGRDAITRHMIALAPYLGHRNIANTYRYL